MATRRLVSGRGALALVLSFCLSPAAALTSAVAAQTAGAGETGRGSIHGTLFQPDEKEPLAGAKVTAINVRTGRQYTSEITGSNGNYDINGLPAGTYDIVIEVAGAIFVADHIEDIGPGEGVSKSYAVQPARPANRRISKLPPPQGSAQAIGETQVDAPFWSSRSGIVLLSLLAAGAGFAIANNNNDDNASPSAP